MVYCGSRYRGDSIVHQGQQSLGGGKYAGSPPGSRLVLGGDDQADRQRLDPGLAAERLDRGFDAQKTVRAANGERGRVGMGAAGFIQHGEFIRIVAWPRLRPGL